MKKYLTVITALHPETMELEDFIGPDVFADSFANAEVLCKKEYPYAMVIGESVSLYELGETIGINRENHDN